jgi:predicted transposase YdaD
MGKFDLSSKHIIHFYNQVWLEWLLKQPLSVESELSGDFQFIGRASDSLLQVYSQPVGRFLALTELEFSPRPRTPTRLTAYAALAREKFNLPVFVTVIYFLPPPKDTQIEEKFHSDFLGQVAHQDFQVIRLWELDAQQVLALQNPALLPFVPLMQGGNSEPVLQECANRIRTQPNAEELETVLSMFAGYVMENQLINRILRSSSMIEILRQSPFYKQILEPQLIEYMKEQLRQEGRQEGQRQMLTTDLQRLLAFRFNIPVGHFEHQFQRLDLNALEQLNDAAFTVSSRTEFEELLTRLLAPLTH